MEFFFAKNDINKFVVTSKNVVPCNLTGCLRLKKNSDIRLNFSSFISQNGLAGNINISLTFKKISGNGIVDISDGNIAKQHIIANTRTITLYNPNDIVISRGNDSLGEVSLIFIAINCDNKKGANVGVVYNKKLYTNLKIETVLPHELARQINSVKEDIFLCIGNLNIDIKKFNTFKNVASSYNIKVVEINDNIESGYLYYFLNKAKYILSDKIYPQCIGKKVFLQNAVQQNIPNVFHNLSFDQILDNILEDYNKQEGKNIKPDVRFKIVIPSYNTERWIKNTLDSIINQTYKNYDVCIVDDVSTDANQKKHNKGILRNKQFRKE
jgi:hypothetical protein